VAFGLHLVRVQQAQHCLYECLGSSGIPTRDAKRWGTGWLAGQADIGWSNHIGWYEGLHVLISIASTAPPGGGSFKLLYQSLDNPSWPYLSFLLIFPFSLKVARIPMTLYLFLFLLMLFLIFGFVRLGHLYGPHQQPSHSKAGAIHTTVQRLLKPRTPLDCPVCRLSNTPSSGVRPAPVPLRPWREMKSRRGAPKRVNTEGFACPNKQCPYSGIIDAHFHALVGDGKHGHTEQVQPIAVRPAAPHSVLDATRLCIV
jgi:hypothetical protein